MNLKFLGLNINKEIKNVNKMKIKFGLIVAARIRKSDESNLFLLNIYIDNKINNKQIDIVPFVKLSLRNPECNVPINTAKFIKDAENSFL
tara:strand:+ start:197 stop:466 length:270 start_codon:yes stop_codon:yes gene_type:complete